MENSKQPAFPITLEYIKDNRLAKATRLGLTKREYVAIEMVKALMPKYSEADGTRPTAYEISNLISVAISSADELLRQLEQGEKKE